MKISLGEVTLEYTEDEIDSIEQDINERVVYLAAMHVADRVFKTARWVKLTQDIYDAVLTDMRKEIKTRFKLDLPDELEPRKEGG